MRLAYDDIQPLRLGKSQVGLGDGRTLLWDFMQTATTRRTISTRFECDWTSVGGVAIHLVANSVVDDPTTPSDMLLGISVEEEHVARVVDTRDIRHRRLREETEGAIAALKAAGDHARRGRSEKTRRNLDRL